MSPRRISQNTKEQCQLCCTESRGIAKLISRITEELFPFPHYFLRSRRKKKLLCDCKDILDENSFSSYKTLSVQQLKNRLKDEHQRASFMDEKTFKLTLALTVGLTVLGITSIYLNTDIPYAVVQKVFAVPISLGLFYVLAAGFLALGALRTRPMYGYGTKFVLKLQQQTNEQATLADALARQETMNLIRHLQNETVYQSLRNGLLLLFLAIFIIFFTLLFC